MADASYPTRPYHAQDGNFVVPSGASLDVESGGTLELAGTAITASAAELNSGAGVTAGTVKASSGVVVDANKDIGDFRNLDAVNIDAGASGSAGSVDIFPATASKGKTAITATNNSGDTTTAIVTAAQAGARTYTIPDAGASASFVLSDPMDGAQAEAGRNIQTEIVFGDDFMGDAGATLLIPWATNAESANSTEDFVTDTLGGVYTIAHSADSEAQAMQLTFGDNLLLDAFTNLKIEARIKLDVTGTNTLGSADQRWVFGVCDDHANAEDALDSVTNHAWFRLEGVDSKIYVEADDDSHDTNDQDSGVTIVDDTWTIFQIDLSTLTDVKFYIDGVEQSGAAVDMSNISSATPMQPIVCIQRAAGAELEKVYVDYIKVICDR